MGPCPDRRRASRGLEEYRSIPAMALARRRAARIQRARTAIGIGRIDPAGEQSFQPLVDARSAEAFLDERVEAERRQVAVVEHNRMTERDRLAVVRLVGQQIE